MTAKEMFKKLDYELYVDNEITLGYVCERKEDYINFYKQDNDISVCCCFSTDILKAINKQVEELGWNNKKTRIVEDIETDYKPFANLCLGDSKRVNDLIKADLVEKVEE